MNNTITVGLTTQMALLLPIEIRIIIKVLVMVQTGRSRSIKDQMGTTTIPIETRVAVMSVIMLLPVTTVRQRYSQGKQTTQTCNS